MGGAAANLTNRGLAMMLIYTVIATQEGTTPSHVEPILRETLDGKFAREQEIV